VHAAYRIRFAAGHPVEAVPALFSEQEVKGMSGAAIMLIIFLIMILIIAGPTAYHNWKESRKAKSQ